MIHALYPCPSSPPHALECIRRFATHSLATHQLCTCLCTACTHTRHRSRLQVMVWIAAAFLLPRLPSCTKQGVPRVHRPWTRQHAASNAVDAAPFSVTRRLVAAKNCSGCRHSPHARCTLSNWMHVVFTGIPATCLAAHDTQLCCAPNHCNLARPWQHGSQVEPCTCSAPLLSADNCSSLLVSTRAACCETCMHADKPHVASCHATSPTKCAAGH
jgi:hypothetical protein